MTRTLFRDPYMRATLVRRTVKISCSCSWCGQKPAQYQYDISADDRDQSFQRRTGAPFNPIRVFCSVRCWSHVLLRIKERC